MKENDILLRFKEVDVSYGGDPVLKNLNFEVTERDFLGIIGPNGGGKTTLVKTVLGLVKPLRGEIAFFEKEKEVPEITIGYLPQMSRIDPKFPVTGREMVLSGLAHRRNRLRRYGSEQQRQLQQTAAQLGIEAYMDKPVGELSGGEMQRVLLGRAIIADPRLLILDEPNTYVDKPFESRFYQLLEEINKKTAILLISHDIGTIISQVKNIACVNGTLHYHKGNRVTTNWLEEGYGCPFEMVGHGAYPHRVLGPHGVSSHHACASPTTCTSKEE